ECAAYAAGRGEVGIVTHLHVAPRATGERRVEGHPARARLQLDVARRVVRGNEHFHRLLAVNWRIVRCHGGADVGVLRCKGYVERLLVPADDDVGLHPRRRVPSGAGETLDAGEPLPGVVVELPVDTRATCDPAGFVAGLGQ